MRRVRIIHTGQVLDVSDAHGDHLAVTGVAMLLPVQNTTVEPPVVTAQSITVDIDEEGEAGGEEAEVTPRKRGRPRKS